MSERSGMSDKLAFATEETYLRRADEKRAKKEHAILTFAVGGEVYGIDILSIREIIKPREITEVPRAPRFLLGILTVRGLVMPILDLRLRLKLDARELTARARILVVVHGGDRFGLLVDEVRDVVRFGDADIEPPPPTFAVGSEAPFLSGIARHVVQDEERMVILLALQALVDFDVRGLRPLERDRA
jgi:purine-binding chemotaxis protein CheW